MIDAGARVATRCAVLAALLLLVACTDERSRSLPPELVRRQAEMMVRQHPPDGPWQVTLRSEERELVIDVYAADTSRPLLTRRLR